MIFRNYMKYTFDKQVKYQPYSKKHFRDKFRNNNTIVKLEQIQSQFYKWMEEMTQQDRSFEPFDLQSSKAFSFINGKIDMDTAESLRYTNWAAVDNQLNKAIGKVKTEESEKRFIELFNRAIKESIKF